MSFINLNDILKKKIEQNDSQVPIIKKMHFPSCYTETKLQIADKQDEITNHKHAKRLNPLDPVAVTQLSFSSFQSSCIYHPQI